MVFGDVIFDNVEDEQNQALNGEVLLLLATSCRWGLALLVALLQLNAISAFPTFFAPASFGLGEAFGDE